MNVSLTKTLEKYVQKLVKKGEYSTASEVVREALRMKIEYDRKLAWMRKEVQKGADQLDRGLGLEYDGEEIKRIGRQRQRLLARKGA